MATNLAMPTILKGDDTGAIVIQLDDAHTYTGATLVFAYQGVTREFTNLVAGGTVTVFFTHDETDRMRLGAFPVLMELIGPTGGRETVANAEMRIKVTDCLAEVNSGSSFVIRPGSMSGVPVTDVGDVADRYTMAELKAKVNQIVRVLAQRSLLGAAFALLGAFCAASAIAAIEVQTARLDELYNDSAVVTNVTGGGGSSMTTNAVQDIIDARIPNENGKVNQAYEADSAYNSLWAYTAVSAENALDLAGDHTEEPKRPWVQKVEDIISTPISSISNTVSNWENYWRGDRVRLSVTNYYGNTSGEPPRLRIEEFDHAITNADHSVSNVYRVVWDEATRQTNYQQRIESKVDAVSNGVMTAAWKQTNLQLTEKAPRAWQSVTSAGEDAPPNTVWHTAPSTVFAGGTEYAHVAVGEGSICVLVDKGAPVFTEGEEGQFRFADESGENFFGFDVRSAYTIGCRTDGISVDNSARLVSLTYDLTSAVNPTVVHSLDLVDWQEVPAEWEQNPPAGTKICYINIGDAPAGFYKSQMTFAGGAKFITNMQADLQGGIAATNETLDVIQSVEPYIQNGQVLWRIKQ